jgi:hypothetical protein
VSLEDLAPLALLACPEFLAAHLVLPGRAPLVVVLHLLPPHHLLLLLLLLLLPQLTRRTAARQANVDAPILVEA